MSCGGVDAQMRPVTLEMRPAPEDVLRMWLIDKKVGNVRNDEQDLLEPQPTVLRARRCGGGQRLAESVEACWEGTVNSRYWTLAKRPPPPWPR